MKPTPLDERLNECKCIEFEKNLRNVGCDCGTCDRDHATSLALVIGGHECIKSPIRDMTVLLQFCLALKLPIVMPDALLQYVESHLRKMLSEIETYRGKNRPN